jgi:hypothetical protein
VLRADRVGLRAVVADGERGEQHRGAGPGPRRLGHEVGDQRADRRGVDEHRCRSGQGGGDRLRLAGIEARDLGAGGQVRGLGLAGQRAHGRALGEQAGDEMAADLAGRPGDQDHFLSPIGGGCCAQVSGRGRPGPGRPAAGIGRPRGDRRLG